VDRLLEQLAELLAAWAVLSWEQNGEAATQQLERAFAVRPDPRLLQALARLHRTTAPHGSMALERLARRWPLPPDEPSAPVQTEEPSGEPEDRAELNDRADPESPLQRLAGLQPPQAARHRCRGPGCPECGLHSLGAWERQPLSPGCELWSPPFTPEPEPELAAEAELIALEGGRAWLRPPLRNPWGTTTALAVADGDGRQREELSRTYPQAWPACLEAERVAAAVAAAAAESAAAAALAPQRLEEPPPPGPPLELAGPVLAVADLSAEIHYHWLLEQLPRLGRALQALAPADRAGLRVWHNGGDQPARLEVLTAELGLAPEVLIDARRHPHIRAERLLVPPFAGRFGWPAAWAQRWLRQRLLPDSEALAPTGGRSLSGRELSGRRLSGLKRSGRKLWLGRGLTARRPVWGEEALLRELERCGLALEAVDLGVLPLRRQARLLAEAELVVAPHGGALAALVFAGAGTRVLELHQPRYAPPYFHALVQERGLCYARCEQPLVAPCLMQDLVYEGPLVEPIVLDPERCVQALQALERVG
jgi:hypothetical protein